MSLEQVWQHIEQRMGGFSPQIRRAARYVREHPQNVALNSLRTLSREADVSPTSMTRLLQALDFGTFDDFQAAHRAWLTERRGGTFSGRADRLVAESRAPGAEDALLDDLATAEAGNVASSLDPAGRALIAEAADLVLAAGQVSILGLRSCFPVAFSLHYALSLFMPAARLVTGTGGSVLDEMHALDDSHVLVVVSVAPYSRESLDAAVFARDHSVPVIAITDDRLSPIAQRANVALVAANASPAHIASPIGPMAVAQAMSLVVLARSGPGAMDALRRREARLAAISAYVTEETAR